MLGSKCITSFAICMFAVGASYTTKIGWKFSEYFRTKNVIMYRLKEFVPRMWQLIAIEVVKLDTFCGLRYKTTPGYLMC